MANKKMQILILEKDVAYRDRLQSLSAGSGKTWMAEDLDEALDLLTRRPF